MSPYDEKTMQLADKFAVVYDGIGLGRKERKALQAELPKEKKEDAFAPYGRNADGSAQGLE